MTMRANCERCGQRMPGEYANAGELGSAATMLDWFFEPQRVWVFCPRCRLTEDFLAAAQFWEDRLDEADKGPNTIMRRRDIESKRAILGRYRTLLGIPPDRAEAAGFTWLNWVIGQLMWEFFEHKDFPPKWRELFETPGWD